MDIEQARAYCLEKKGVTEGFPFGEEVLVFKVLHKMFATLALDTIPTPMNLKCAPEKAMELRDQYEAIQPGYHMNKKHWNTITLDHSLPPALISELIDHSYNLVVNKLSKADREQLKPLSS